ncbi:rhomboid family intramembrane serine protease [Phaeobacter sp. C3_T13_0]|uniref:rhomboid family intramembrane serine protease n=1 Tax=Phaeobacter cretensis TaxID=3342641 RepID=UPI0039BC54F1
MFPIRDHNPSGRTPYVTYALIIANIAIFVLTYFGYDNPRRLTALYNAYALLPAEVVAGYDWQTLLTSTFLHAGWMHLGGNMLFLWIFGDNMEDEMGHFIFLAFYVVCGIGAGLIHVASAPTSLIPLVGASGAIAGVMGGYLLLFPKARVDILLILIVYFRVFSIPAFVMLGLWLGMQFLGGIGSNPQAGGVAYWAHAGGFGVGLVLTIPLWLRRGGRAYWDKTHGQPPHPETSYSASRIPRVQRKRSAGDRRNTPWGK